MYQAEIERLSTQCAQLKVNGSCEPHFMDAHYQKKVEQTQSIPNNVKELE
jgi:hypothetical protein